MTGVSDKAASTPEVDQATDPQEARLTDESVTVAYSGWDDDAGWYEESSPHETRKRIPADLWQRYQQARDAVRAAQDGEWEVSEEISKFGEDLPAACRHTNKGFRWSAAEGMWAVCSCGEEFPWSDPCPHPFYNASGDRDVCGVCAADLPYVVVPLVGGPKDGETTHFHGEWSPYACQIMLTGDNLNYYLRNGEEGLRYVFSERSGVRQ